MSARAKFKWPKQRKRRLEWWKWAIALAFGIICFRYALPLWEWYLSWYAELLFSYLEEAR